MDKNSASTNRLQKPKMHSRAKTSKIEENTPQAKLNIQNRDRGETDELKL